MSGGVPSLWKGFWGQIRWQLLACYLLIGGVSVLLVVALAAAALNMLIRRGTSVAVERQIDLFVQSTAGRVDSLAGRMEAQAEAAVDQRRRPFASALPARLLPGTHVAVRCSDGTGRELTYSYPETNALNLPGWIEGDTFQSVVSEGTELDIRAFARRRGLRCLVEVLSQVALDEQIAGMIARASELTVTTPTPPPGAPPGGPLGDRPFWRRFLGFALSSYGGPVPVAVVTRDWATGRLVDRIAFRVQPNYETSFRQLRRFGQRQSLWVYALWVLGIAFLIVEMIALFLAVRVTRRIIRAVDDLSHAAGKIGAGNLSHRIQVQRDDQLGQLSRSFNKMAASLETLVRETREKERMQQELIIARQVQESLYPRTLPALPKVQLAAACLPARNVSGDLYDVLEIGPNRLGLLCADVSGKGVPAALLSASLQAVVRSAAQNGDGRLPSPAELVARINEHLCRGIPDNRFITLFWADYDAETRLLRATNAGHCPPVLCGYNGGSVTRFEAGGPPVGVFPGTQYAEQQFVLKPGSLLVVHTDGVPEAENTNGEEFGDRRLIELCRAGGERSPEELIAEILKARQEWAGDVEQSDDVTLVVMKAR